MGTTNGVRLSGRKQSWPHWTTPESILQLVRQVGPISLDPFWNEQAITTPAVALQDGPYGGLTESWKTVQKGLAFVNPPYAMTADVVGKCKAEADTGVEIILLVAARTDSKWAHQCFDTADAMCFWKGRIKFGNPPPDSPGNAPSIASAFYYWGPSRRLFLQTFGPHGFCLDLAARRERKTFPVRVLP
jgi:hypothetical protein